MTDTPKKRYILDTNMLIGFGFWIPISLNKFFWNKFSEYLKNAEWILLDVVTDEVKYKGDLRDWCKQQRQIGTVCPLGDDCRTRAAEINNQYKMIDDVTKRSTVDTYVIAYAEKNNLIVLSREGNRKNQTELFKIPDVCGALNIQCVRDPKVFLEAMNFSN